MEPDLEPTGIAKKPYMPPITQNIPTKGPLLPGKKNNTLSMVVYLAIGVIIIGLLIFGLMSFSKMNKYKNNVDALINTAVGTAIQKTQAADDTKYQNEAKAPNKTYLSSSVAGSVKIVYPKTWSAYIIESQQDASPVNAYFYPNFVPDVSNPVNIFSLRMQVLNASYAQTMDQFTGQLSGGKIKIAAFIPKNVPSVTGSLITGAIDPAQPTATGTMVVLPLRDKIIEIWCDNASALEDFNATVLPNLTFTP
jgi:hypothetical protein